MDYDALLELSTEVGYRLLESGGEIYRVEESIRRLLEAYNPQSAEIFAIPNCIIACVVTPEGKTLTRVRRMPSHGTDLDQLERYNALCRAACEKRPDVETLREWLAAAGEKSRGYSFPVMMAAYFFGTAFFSLFFGGAWQDALCAGVCGMAICLCQQVMARRKANLFFRTLASAAVSGLIALGLTVAGLGRSVDLITIGALMVLVPGVAITNAMREFMGGDLVAGVSRVAEAVLIGTAIALGTAAALSLAPSAAEGVHAMELLPFLHCLYAFCACAGVSCLLNVHGLGQIICCAGGALGWLVYLLAAPAVQNEILQSFLAAVAIAVFAEVMARLRKCPVTSYLLVALFPLVPGGGIYYAMEHCIRGETQLFLETLLHTFGVAGALAVGALLVSSAVRLIVEVRRGRHTKRQREE